MFSEGGCAQQGLFSPSWFDVPVLSLEGRGHQTATGDSKEQGERAREKRAGVSTRAENDFDVF
jgi:hypothetical protein